MVDGVNHQISAEVGVVPDYESAFRPYVAIGPYVNVISNLSIFNSSDYKVAQQSEVAATTFGPGHKFRLLVSSALLLYLS